MASSSAVPSSAAPTVPLRRDIRTIVLIGIAHGTSHFFHMVLPPLFPLFIRDFGFSYAELGLLVSTFFIISGIGQAAAGFLVDRVGARPVMFAALSCFLLSALATATAQGYGGLMLASALAGLGNASFHPVDFTILNKRVSQARLGHAFSVHGITGNLGWALAPLFLAGIIALTGSWRIATACCAGWVLVVMALLWWHRDAIDDKQGAWAHETAAKTVGAGAGAVLSSEHPMAFLKLPSVWMCFSFFFWYTCALAAVQSFASPALQSMYGLGLSLTTLAVTGFMVMGAAGMVVGGFLVGRAERLEKVIGVCMLASAVALGLAGSGWLPGLAAVAVVAIAGFGTGMAGPSRDMLIKRAAPPGATGRVYGTVYSGLDLGFALAAPAFGALMDHGSPPMVFYGAGAALLMGVLSATMIGANVAQRGRAARVGVKVAA